MAGQRFDRREREGGRRQRESNWPMLLLLLDSDSNDRCFGRIPLRIPWQLARSFALSCALLARPLAHIRSQLA